MADRRSAPLALVAVLLLVGACTTGGDDGAASTTTTPAADTSPSTAAAPAPPPSTSTTTTPAEPPRAFVIAPVVRPLAPSSTTVPDDGTTPLSHLEVGQCADLPGLGGVETVEVEVATVLACEDPHAVEIFAVGSIEPDPAAPYPGDDAVLAAADQLCLGAFAAYVGAQYVDSELEIVHLRPDEVVWLTGDRDVRCAVHARDLEPLVGSVKESGR